MSTLLGKRRTKRTVVLLCTGDTCRGPMAQGYMRHALNEKGIKHVDVKTAGVMTIPGLIPTPEASQVMNNAGIDISQHRSSPLTPELIHKADIILGMTPFHVQFALRESEEAKNKTYLLKEFAESDVKNYQITDPMGMTLEVYKRVYREMKLAIDKMIEAKEFFKEPPVDDFRRLRNKKVEEPAPEPAPLTPAPTAKKAAPGKAAPVPAAAPSKNGKSGAKAAATAKPAPAPAKAAAKPAAKPAPAAPAKKADAKDAKKNPAPAPAKKVAAKK
ncbi:MAG TPA: low molecular weight protein arginine phosphatase [Candidatus Sumerlaeota bacterium]|nr:low molecular weight protein arginine phosphatase [Candidatus Sumerlaeota bacterium]